MMFYEDTLRRPLDHISAVKPRLREGGWRQLWPTHRQAAVFADRGWAKPETRGEAFDILARVAAAEGWT